jgi:putative DNA methylase
VKSPNPAFAHVDVPLVSNFLISSKAGKEAYVEPLIEHGGFRFAVRIGKPKQANALKRGTRAGKAQDFLCLMSGVPVPRAYIREEGRAGRLGTRLMAVVAEGERGKVYISPTEQIEHVSLCDVEDAAILEARTTFLSGRTPTRAMITGGVCSAYGLSTWGSIFSPRPLVTLLTFSDLVQEAVGHIRQDAIRSNIDSDDRPLRDGGAGALAYAHAVAVYLALAVDRLADYWTSLGRWQNANQQLSNMFSRQAIPMMWDYPEANPFSERGGSFTNLFEWTVQSISNIGVWGNGKAAQADAAAQTISDAKIVSADPPYYDNINYSESVGLLLCLAAPLNATLFSRSLCHAYAVPKADELVATFLSSRRQGEGGVIFSRWYDPGDAPPGRAGTPGFSGHHLLCIQTVGERQASIGTANTGWDTFLAAVIDGWICP